MLKKILAFAMLCGVTFSAYAKLEFALECHHDSGKAPGTEYFYSFGTTAEIFDINGNQKLSEWGNLKLTSTSIENYEYSQYSTYPKPQLTAIANWKKTYTLNRASLNLLRNIDFRSNDYPKTDFQRFFCSKLENAEASYKQNNKLLQEEKVIENQKLQQQQGKNKI